MTIRHETVPFGLKFEESAPAVNCVTQPEYDEQTGLSFVQTVDGDRVPYVQFSMRRTQTFTKVRAESSDDDVPTRTGTMTEVARETTDVD